MLWLDNRQTLWFCLRMFTYALMVYVFSYIFIFFYGMERALERVEWNFTLLLVYVLSYIFIFFYGMERALERVEWNYFILGSGFECTTYLIMFLLSA